VASAREPEAQSIREALESHRVVGVLGEAEVGKSATITQALRPDQRSDVLAVDLDGAAGDGHVGFLLAKRIARALVGPTDLSLLVGGVLTPRRVENRRVDLAELLGIDGMQEALSEWPSGRYSAVAGMSALRRFAQDRPLTLWLDHLEAPALTPRHPLDVERLLWDVRDLQQTQPDFRVVLSAREAFAPELLGPRAAFHQQGRWLTLDVPLAEAWSVIATSAGIRTSTVRSLVAATGGHLATMQLALLEVAGTSRSGLRADDVLRDLAARDDGLAARAMQHARTLHRLGGQVLSQIARGERPYGALQRGGASNQEIRKVLNRLRLAGLLRRSDGWRIVNPLVAMRLRGSVWGPAGVDDDEDELGRRLT